MSEEEITALAREYAEECAEEVGVMFNPQNWACSKCEIEAKAVIIWLLRRFCLVEKDKVREAFWRLTDKFLTDNDTKSFGAASVVLESLFPEIAKEVEG